MEWKKYCSLVILVFSVTFVFSQTESLLVLSDSLNQSVSGLDSLNVAADLDSLTAATIFVENEEDEALKLKYLAYKDLFSKVEQYKSEHREEYIADSNKLLFWSVQGHLFGLSADNYYLKRDKFTELNSLYPTFQKLQNYNRFYQESNSNDFYFLNKKYYQLPVTAIEVVAGMGDYDLGSGYVALKKNYFLNRYNLDFRMNFLKGNLYSGNELASNSSANLVIPFKESNLNIAFNSISYEGPFNKLSPGFRLSSLIWEENSNSVAAIYNNEYVDVGLRFTGEKYKNITPQTLSREYWQLLLAKEVNTDHWHSNISYEFFYHDEDFYSQELNSLSSDIDHLLNLQFNSDYEKFNLSANLVTTLPYQLLSNSEVSYNINTKFKLGVFTNFRKTLHKANLFTDYIPTADAPLPSSLYLNEKNNTGLTLSFTDHNLNLNIALGSAEIETEALNASLHEEYQAFKAQLSGDYTYIFNTYKLNLQSLVRIYQEYDKYNILYTPKFNLTNSIELIKDIKHNNLLRFGISHHFFDSYLGYEKSDKVFYPECSLLDIYVGAQITQQFEIRGYWKNILDYQVIAGERFVPQSMIVLISWNFLN